MADQTVLVAVDIGTTVAFCYRLTNTGNEILDVHDVVDSRLGQVVGPDLDDPLGRRVVPPALDRHAPARHHRRLEPLEPQPALEGARS